MKNSIIIKGILFVVLATILFFFPFVWDIASYLNPEVIEKWLSRAGIYAPVVYMVFMAGAVIVSPIPSLPLDIAAGAFFGPFLGTLYSAAGALFGAILSFLIARYLGRELIERFLGGHINFCKQCSDMLLVKVIFLSRLIPVVSFDIVSYGAGLTKISLKKFALATFLGMLPLTFIYNYFGSIIVVGQKLTIGFGMIMVILFFLIPRWIEKYDLLHLRNMFQHD
jgi:uncharacterized membrane protein YdjX (TVP38/TMEM64 family)